tara:strand:+ start:3469 stop:3822 length:354 start_codon:yes stop_codon:yes gene_type:complete
MKHQCPLCGTRDVELPLTLLEDRGMVAVDGRFVLLTGKEMQLLMEIAGRFPGAISRERLLTRLYSLQHTEAEIKIIDVYICKIRKKLKSLGINIETHWGQGYSLSVRADVVPSSHGE